MKRLLSIAVIGVALFTSGCATPSSKDIEIAHTQRRLGEVKLSQGELAMAIRAFRQSVDLNPHDPEAHFGLAEAYRRKGLLDEAEAHLREATRLRPEFADAKLNLGVIFITRERWDEAIAVFESLASDPTFIRPSRALVNLGWAQYKSGDLEGARQTLELAVGAERRNPVAHLNLGVVLYEQGELIESIQHLEKVVELVSGRGGFASTEAEARFRQAQAYVKLGRRGEAIRQLEEASQRGG